MDFEVARRNMVECQVRPNNVTDAGLLTAMAHVPRENFVPADRRTTAYVEQDIDLFDGRALIKARDFSKLVNDLHIQRGDTILDIGCGYGYSSAILSCLCSMVVGLEEEEAVVQRAEEALRALDIDNAAIISGPLTGGAAKQAPFDIILLNGTVPSVPAGLTAQLVEGGKLGAFVAEGPIVRGTVFLRTGDAVGARVTFDAQTRAVLPGFATSDGFVF